VALRILQGHFVRDRLFAMPYGSGAEQKAGEH